MKNLLYLSIIAILFASCSNSTNKETKSEQEITATENFKLAENFYKRLKGKIGEDIFITMDLIRRKDSLNLGKSFSGHYYYDKIGMPLELYGTINDSAIFELNETDSKGNSTGVFKGKFINENEARGTFTNTKTQKEYPFELKADPSNDNLFSFSEYYNENCKKREANMKSTKKDTLGWLDTMCCSVHVSLVKLADESNSVNKKINALILSNLLSMGIGEGSPKSIKELLHSIDDYGQGDVMEEEIATGIVSNENNVLSMSLTWWANSGGAHPNGGIFYLNFDKRTGDTLSLLQIVKPETIDEVWARGKQQFIKENGSLKENDWFFGEEFFLPKNFAITKGGILFQYNPYEAGPYAMGAPQFFLSNAQIKDIVKPEYMK